MTGAIDLHDWNFLVGRWKVRHRRLKARLAGGFQDGIGTFLADETFDGRPIKVRFRWSAITARSARWEQAFSPNGGTAWETNWFMDFARDGA